MEEDAYGKILQVIKPFAKKILPNQHFI